MDFLAKFSIFHQKSYVVICDYYQVFLKWYLKVIDVTKVTCFWQNLSYTP